MKRIAFCILSLLLAGASIFLASSASATVNPEAPPTTLPTCPGPTPGRLEEYLGSRFVLCRFLLL